MKTSKGRWLVTGAAGYLASNLLALKPEILSDAILMDLEESKVYENQINLISSFSDLETLENFFGEIELSGIIHLAALKSVPDSYLDPHGYNKTNFDDSKNLFNFAKAKGAKKFIFASSAAVYSSPKEREITTENSDVTPLSPYGRSKLKFEEFLISNKSEGMDIYALRFFNLAGGRIDARLAGGAVNAVVKAGLQDKPFFVNGGIEGTESSLNSVRDYISAIDAANAILACATDNATHPFDVYNVSTGIPTSLRDVIEHVQLAMGNKIKISAAENYSEEVNWMVGDPGKMYQKLGWKAQYTIQELIEELVRGRNT
jgi:UDP-glucose 4-epimerase